MAAETLVMVGLHSIGTMWFSLLYASSCPDSQARVRSLRSQFNEQTPTALIVGNNLFGTIIDSAACQVVTAVHLILLNPDKAISSSVAHHCFLIVGFKI